MAKGLLGRISREIVVLLIGRTEEAQKTNYFVSKERLTEIVSGVLGYQAGKEEYVVIGEDWPYDPQTGEESHVSRLTIRGKTALESVYKERNRVSEEHPLGCREAYVHETKLLVDDPHARRVFEAIKHQCSQKV